MDIDTCTRELLLSLTSLDLYVKDVLNVKVLIYTLDQHLESFSCLTSFFPNIDFEFIAVDTAFPIPFQDYPRFVKTIVPANEVDRHCIVRMMTDSSILDLNSYRLFIGTDVVFSKIRMVLGSLGKFCI